MQTREMMLQNQKQYVEELNQVKQASSEIINQYKGEIEGLQKQLQKHMSGDIEKQREAAASESRNQQLEKEIGELNEGM